MCRQLLVLGDAAAVGELLWGLLVEGGEGYGGNNDFNTVSLLGLQLCFDLLVTEVQDFTAEIRRGEPGTSWPRSVRSGVGSQTNNDSRSIQLRGDWVLVSQ